MILLNFDTWNSKHGYFLSWRRIYRNGKWTPFCRVGKRYDSWFGYWKVPDPTMYELSVDILGPFSTCPSVLLHIREGVPLMRIADSDGNELPCTNKDGVLSIGIAPKATIHIIAGGNKFTNEDIEQWAKGNVENADWPRWIETSIIECLSQIIVNRVLK